MIDFFIAPSSTMFLQSFHREISKFCVYTGNFANHVMHEHGKETGIRNLFLFPDEGCIMRASILQHLYNPPANHSLSVPRFFLLHVNGQNRRNRQGFSLNCASSSSFQYSPFSAMV